MSKNHQEQMASNVVVYGQIGGWLNWEKQISGIYISCIDSTSSTYVVQTLNMMDMLVPPE
jgi:hypothetical protein